MVTNKTIPKKLLFSGEEGVKVTLGSAARPWRALVRHSAGTCISSGTLQQHFSFTGSFLIHSFYTFGSHDLLVNA